jgi:manganese/zinc/iron transport system substrate-binding protein
MADVLERLAERKPVVAVSDKIPRETLRQPKEFQGNYDPHIWFDVSMWTLCAERIRDALVQNDPAHAAGYNQRFERYKKELDELGDWVRHELGTIPKERRILVTAHDAFGYFGRAYDVEVLAIQGVSTDSEASLQDINHLVSTLVSRNIPAVFVESSVSQKAVQALVEGSRAQGHEVKIGGELFSDALGKAGTPNGTYIGMVRHNVDTIRDALMGGAK